MRAGVVVGWDRECERDAGWAAAVSVNPHQPFYHVLPDEGAGSPLRRLMHAPTQHSLERQLTFGRVKMGSTPRQEECDPHPHANMGCCSLCKE
jgi:hypothetical protein